MTDIPKFSDFSTGEQLEGEKIKFEDAMGKQITVTAHKTIPDKFAKNEGDTVTIIQFKLGDKTYITFTRSSVLVAQLKMMSEKGSVPFTATIVKQKRYLTFK